MQIEARCLSTHVRHDIICWTLCEVRGVVDGGIMNDECCLGGVRCRDVAVPKVGMWYRMRKMKGGRV